MTQKLINILLPAIFLAGCASGGTGILDGRKADYRRDDYQTAKDLKQPPDVILARENNETQLLSEYRIGAVPEIGSPDEIALAGERKVSYRREGNLRWLDLDLPAADSWNLIREFWMSLEFELANEDAPIGTLETGWLDLRKGAQSVGLGGYLDDFLGRLRDSGERDKFITRIETDGEVTAIYVAHRRIAANFDKDGLFSGYTPIPADPQLETEILRRIMIFAARTPEEEQDTAFTDDIESEEERASEDYTLEETQLVIKKPPEESWLLVRIGLDRGGFTIEDQDYAERAYYIRHSGGPESQQIFGKAETGFFNQIFGDEKPILREIKMTLVGDEEDNTVITVAASDDGEPLTDLQSSVLLELLSVNLP